MAFGTASLRTRPSRDRSSGPERRLAMRLFRHRGNSVSIVIGEAK